ncbi:MAG: long-chain fatty acid--CoA ligase [Hyphomicrobiales bacterium]|nr:MAG: long-chain fatty acid--CoA ligase [Hyphomicrobiales bacterium]
MTGTLTAASADGDTFPKLLLRNAAVRGGKPAIREKDLGIWQTWTWSEVADEVCRFAIGLKELGFGAGDKVAIIGSNRPRLYWGMLAAQSLGGVPVPVYADSVAEEMAYVLSHAEVVFAVVEDQEQVDKVLGVSEQVPMLKQVIYDDQRGLRDYDHTHLHSFEEVQKQGAAIMAANAGAKKAWEEGIAAGKGSDISVMLYTSGTTGRSKGVMLSGERCVAAATDTVKFDKLTENDEALAYLPLAWVGDHYLNYAQGIVAGFCTACPESPETAAQNLREIGPTFYFAPPRVFEANLTTVMIRMEDAGKFKQKMFNYFLGVAKQYGEKILNKQPVPLGGRLLYALGGLLVYGPLKNVLGFSRIRVAYTAGEAIGPDLFSFYRSLGMNLKQLYGQTEAFLYVTCQEDGHVRSDTVGPPAPNVDIKITDDGEVVFRSPGRFVAYYKNEEATRDTMTEDGWVHTGDAGFFDTDGQLKIIDRAKDVGKLADGTMFAPKYIENKLKFFPNVKEVVAFGDERDFCTAFINIDLNAVGNWAERNNIAYASYQELAQHPDVYGMIEEHVDKVNQDLAGEPRVANSQIKRFLVLHKELDADDGELTRTQKVRRNFIAERYATLIEALYDGSSEKFVETEVTFEDGRTGKVSATVQIRDMTMHPVRSETVQEAAE